MILTNSDILDFIDNNYHKEFDLIKLVTIKKNKNIVEQGKSNKYIYILKEGIVKCSIMEENYKSYALEFLGIGEIIGEIETLLKCKNLATVKTLTDCMLSKLKLTFLKST